MMKTIQKKIINNDFELGLDANCNPVPVVFDMYGWSNNAWRPKDTCNKYHGWICDFIFNKIDPLRASDIYTR